jgi:hypothetical protein
MKVEIITQQPAIYPSLASWGLLGLLAIIAVFAIIGQMWASKRLSFMGSDWYQLSIAYLGVFLITAVGLANGGFS